MNNNQIPFDLSCIHILCWFVCGVLYCVTCMLNVSTLTGRLIGLVRSVPFIFCLFFVLYIILNNNNNNNKNRDRDSIFIRRCVLYSYASGGRRWVRPATGRQDGAAACSVYIRDGL